MYDHEKERRVGEDRAQKLGDIRASVLRASRRAFQLLQEDAAAGYPTEELREVLATLGDLEKALHELQGRVRS